jgi:exonuclease SbcC
VDRFRALLGARVEEAFSNWERTAGCPRENRGIERPWKRQVGLVLAAFYAKEELRAKAAAAREWEAGLDRLGAELREAAAAAAAEESFVAAHAKAAADARERETLEAQAGKLALEVARLTKAASEWPGAVEKARGLAEAVDRLSAGRGPLEQELEEARRGEQDRALRERVGRVQRRKERLAKARQALAAVTGVEREALEEIRAAARELERIQDGLAAGKLSVTVAGRKDTEVSVQEDFGPAQSRRLGAGSVARLSAAGRIRIVHPDIEIEVHSGDAEGEARARGADKASARLDAACRAAGVSSREEAESRWSAFEPLAADAAAAEKALAEELGGETLPDFEARAAALGPERPGRQAPVIAAELATLAADIQHVKADLERLGRQVQEWQGEHGSFEKVIEKLADARGASKAAAERTAQLAPLPAGFAAAGAFLRRWEAARDSAAASRVRESGLRGRISGMQDAAPEQSSEELAAELAEAESGFAAALRRGEALLRVEKAAAGITGASDAAVGTAMRADLEKTLAAMTGGRYASVEMEGTLPSAVLPAGGVRVDRKLLSAGTADSLALALRLVMARRFLAKADGFMVMDDPLVEMDPDRQGAAAAALREFAAERQLVVFTCHPSTAGLLGGNLVEL